MSNPNPVDVQVAALRNIWEQYRGYAKTSRRLKAEQGQWRRLLLWCTVVALLLTPFSKTFETLGLGVVSSVLALLATLLFSLTAWLHKDVLGDESEQPWVRSRQTGEGLKALAFRFLGGLSPFDALGIEVALKQAEALAAKAGISPDSVSASEAAERIPPAPLLVEDYLELRVDDQILFYANGIERERAAQKRIVLVGRVVSAAVVAAGVLGTLVAKNWRDIWAPALGAAASLATAQNARARHRFLIDSYSTTQAKLKFARARWEGSPADVGRDHLLVETVEATLASENAGWVQQMLLKPVVPDHAPAVAAE
jgi:hypothetical protein